jgi:hypothetical protein
MVDGCHANGTPNAGKEAIRRERARLCSERRRRAHGIMPRKPAERPWLEAGCSRSTWYRRRKQARERAALAIETNRRRLVLSRAEAFVTRLQAELAEAARCHAIMAGIIAEAVEWHVHVQVP